MNKQSVLLSEEDLQIIFGADLKRRQINNGTLCGLYVSMCFMEHRLIGKNSDWSASIDDIAEEAMISRDSVILGIKILEVMGMLRVVRDTKEKGKVIRQNRYKITGSAIITEEEINRTLKK